MMTVEQKLIERHMQPDLYHVSIDEEDGVAAFMLYNLSGRIVGYQNYRWAADKMANNDPRMSRYYTHTTSPTESKTKEIAVFGMETYHFRHDILFVVEGVFDAVRLHNLGLPCIAALSNNPKQLRPWLRATARHIVCVCDGDSAGRKLAKLGHEAVELPENLDLGDMTDEQVQETVSKWL